MRLFVAVEIDQAVRRSAARVSAALASALDRGGHRRSVAWVAPQNLHLTLQFLGEVDPARGREVVDCLAPPLSTPAFDIALAGLGTFPPRGPVRVVWMGLAAGAAQVAALYSEIGVRLGSIGFPPEPRPFHPHLTLGRVKSECGPRFRDAIDALREADAGRCRVDHATLFESRLSPSGATYSVLATTPLGYHLTS